MMIFHICITLYSFVIIKSIKEYKILVSNNVWGSSQKYSFTEETVILIVKAS